MGKHMSTLKERKLKFETLQLHVGQEEPDPVTDARAVPIYQTSSYVFHNSKHAADRFGLRDAGNIYGRLTNPTEDIFEQRIAALEGGVAALAVGSGAAAVTYTIENLAQAGDHIVSAKNIYGGTYNLLAHTLVDFGVTTTFVDPFNLEEVEGAIKDNTKAVYIETLGNPNSEVVDIEALAEIAHKHKIPLVIDNTFGTPYLIRPIEYGADIVVHSATKFIGGHGTTIGGVIIDGGKFDWAASGKFPQLTEPNPSYHGVSFAAAAGPAAFVTRIRAILLRDTGATLSPIHAFIFLQGLETLSLRVERHVENALKVVEFLEKQPLVEKVNHPSVSEDPEQQRLYKKYFPNGGGSIFTFEIKGDDKKAQEFIDHLQLFSLLANVADVKSLVIHPASTTHAELDQYEQLPTDDETDMNTICQLASEVAKDNRQKDVEVLFEPAKENLLIRSNSERISQVLNNLAHNAAKFTTHGSIRIAYSVLEAEKKIEISVTDTGTGIPKDQQEAVFERFYKMNSFTQGTGLGLPICRSIAEKLGGSLRIDTSYTEGCRMILTLPLIYA